MKTLSAALACLAIGLAAASPLVAEAEAEAGSDTVACLDQWRAACGDAADPRARAQCLNQHRDEFSRECTMEIRKQMRAQRVKGGLRQVCAEELSTVCKGVRGAPIHCLREHVAELSGGCAEAVAKRPASRPQPKRQPQTQGE